ncbi:MAG: protease complex subunit PrcB family protein [Dorea sp.]|nr:protease complex subunit PrcB family protein [Dorea sp.]
MRKKYLLLLPLIVLILTACSVRKADDKKLRDVEFTVLDKDDVPEEFMAKIEEAKEGQVKLSYADRGYLYIARGYGQKETSGYSVEVRRCYETENEIHVETGLLGPGKEEKILKKKTCPYVVIKTEYTDKQIEFD